MSSRVLPSLFERVAGAGAPVLLLHAAASSSAQWRAVTAHLTSRHQVVAPDLFGEGDSPDAPTGWGVIEADLDALTARIMREPQGITLVGHSYGAVLALELALRLGERIRRLVVIEPVAFYLLRERALDASQIELEDTRKGIERAVRRAAHHEAAQQFVDYWSGAHAFTSLPAATQLALARSMPKVALGWRELRSLTRSALDYARLRVPTTVLLGERSRGPMAFMCSAISNHVPDALLRVVAGAGHMLPLSHFQAVRDSVLEPETRSPPASLSTDAA